MADLTGLVRAKHCGEVLYLVYSVYSKEAAKRWDARLMRMGVVGQGSGVLI